jgi:antitoxin (DNA-binding transcriptional repressor) of toxin-antitoxin stability system
MRLGWAKLGHARETVVRPVDIKGAALHLSRLVELVAAGEEIVIANGGAPVARLLPPDSRREPRKPGLLEGQIWIAEDFDDPLPEETMAAFRGERP